METWGIPEEDVEEFAFYTSYKGWKLHSTFRYTAAQQYFLYFL